MQVIFRACTAVTVTRGSFWLILAAGVEGALAASCNHISRDPHQVLAPAPSTFRNCNMGAVEACNSPKPSPQSATIHNRKSFNNHRHHHKVRAKSLSGPVSITPQVLFSACISYIDAIFFIKPPVQLKISLRDIIILWKKCGVQNSSQKVRQSVMNVPG